MMLRFLDLAIGFSVVVLLLSLMVTVLVQAAVAAFGLRGRNLAWGVESLVEKLGMKWGNRSAKDVAREVLTHTFVSSATGRLASGIREADLVRILRELGPAKEEAANPKDSRLKPDAAKVLEELEKLFPGQAQKVRDAIDGALRKGERVAEEVHVWFGAMMTRVQERFTLQTRWWTGGFALVLCFALHLDTLRFVQQLSSNPALAARLASQGESYLASAETTIARTAQTPPLASQALRAAGSRLPEGPDRSALENAPDRLVSSADGERWLRQALGASVHREAALKAFQEQYSELSRQRLGELHADFTALRSQLEETEFTLVPAPFPSYATYVTEPRHLLGTLMTAMLLSMGAPFWYKVLRELVGLRPAGAREADKDRKGS